MADRYQQLVNNPIGRIVAKQVGLPQPPPLERYRPGQPVIDGPVLVGGATGARLGEPIQAVLGAIGAETVTGPVGSGDQRFKALVFDATGISSAEELREAYAFFHPVIRQVRSSGRVIVLGTPPPACREPGEASSQWALDGLVRSIGKESRGGATAQLLYVAPGAEEAIESSLRFFLSPRSAYVSGQVVEIGEPASGNPADLDWQRPLQGKVALVTGAARGIGRSIAEVLARDGAHVVGLDVPPAASDLDQLTSRLEGSALTVDITAEDAPKRIADHLEQNHQGVDVVVHNAGVTRDKTLGRMSEEQWSTVIGINLLAPQRIDRELFSRELVRQGGRVVLVSSISGIAGNAGQTNYATSKAGIIGLVHAWAPWMADHGVTINAVAPGFIETQMTAAMPIVTREAGRRMNSLSQGGLPVDVAETIAWFASPGSSGVNGNVVRVCGQSLIGA